MPSEDILTKTSRIGVRETPNRCARVRSSSRSPGRILPTTISSSIVRRIASRRSPTFASPFAMDGVERLLRVAPLVFLIILNFIVGPLELSTCLDVNSIADGTDVSFFGNGVLERNAPQLH